MAARLSVVMVHTAPPTSLAARLAETLVGELIGRPGIDLALVGPIADLPTDSTDRLTLESLAGDVAVLAWQSAADTIEDLQQIGFSGKRSVHVGDPDAGESVAMPSTSQQRRIYGFNLNDFSDARPVIEALQTLLKSRGIKTFVIGGASPIVSSSGTPPRPVSQKAGAIAKNASNESVRPRRGPSQALDLDDLLDQLDRSDS